ncbi:MAG: hypothetical protein Q8940_19035, partial [Bacteroidota bacterium]|nr:hypothetical protein [Bacteroidota bacterium]
KSMRLCLFDLKAKPLKYLLDIASSEEWLDFKPPVFSPNDKYLAYVKNTNQPGPRFTWESSLYIMELSTGKSQYIDEANDPQWNPATVLNPSYLFPWNIQ